MFCTGYISGGCEKGFMYNSAIRTVNGKIDPSTFYSWSVVYTLAEMRIIHPWCESITLILIQNILYLWHHGYTTGECTISQNTFGAVVKHPLTPLLATLSNFRHSKGSIDMLLPGFRRKCVCKYFLELYVLKIDKRYVLLCKTVKNTTDKHIYGLCVMRNTVVI